MQNQKLFLSVCAVLFPVLLLSCDKASKQAPQDAGTQADGGTVLDGGVPWDGGGLPDGGIVADGGGQADGGEVTDGGDAAVDSGADDGGGTADGGACGPEPRLLKNLNTYPVSSNPLYFAMANGHIFFGAYNGTHGMELWKINLSTYEVAMAADVYPGENSSGPGYLTTLGDLIVFSATHPDYGRELFRHNSLTGQTDLVKDIRSGSSDSNPGPFTVIGNKFYFPATETALGTELWESDGTEAGTKIVRDIRDGGSSSSPSSIAASGNKLFFCAREQAETEVWVHNPSAQDTHKLIGPHDGGYRYCSSITAGSDTVFFWGNDYSESAVFSASSSSEKGRMAAGPDGGVPYNNVSYMAALGTRLFFAASDKAGVYNNELWRYEADGGTASMVADLSLVEGNPSSPKYTFAAGNRLLFSCDGKHPDGGYIGREPWVHVPADNDTRPIADLCAGTCSSDPAFLHNNGNLTLFAATSSGHEELFIYNSTTGGVSLAAAVDPWVDVNYPSTSRTGLALGGNYYLAADEGTHGNELWSVPMNPAATGSAQMLYDIWPGDQGSDPRYLTAAGGRMVFYARDNTYGPEIWSTDGTEINTVMLKDLYQGKLGSAPRNFAYFNGMVYFSATGFLGGASETVLGEELWRYNPSNQESSLVEDINKQNSGYDSSNPYSLYPLGNTLFFGANDGVHGYELWKHTAAGETAMVKDAATIGSGIDSINPWMASIGNKLFYRGTDGQNGNELWQSDGTEPGTFMVANIHASGNSNPFRMTPIGGKLYFSATNSSGLTQLWRYDPGTVGLVDLSAGLGSSSQGLYPQYYAVAGATLYFQGRDDAHGIELWKHDTGTGVTMMVEDVWPGTSSGEPSFLTTVGNLVYFTAKSQDHGQELWVHDTIGGATSMVRDIMPGTAGAGITGMTVHGNRLYFQADDGVNGKELWATNETGDNACMAGNTAPGAVSSSPTYLYEWNGRLYFKAYTPELGTELWYVE